jgi:phytanoyl-CoA hydroxylase
MANPETDAYSQQVLTTDQLALWQKQGYLVMPGFKSADEVGALCDRARDIVEAFEPDGSASRFSTRDRALVADAALLGSAHAVHCFFEEEALDEQGRLRVLKAQSINKIGHALHVLDPVFQRFSRGPALAGLAAQLGLAQPQVHQSQVIFKQPHIGGEVDWHQDASFFVTEPLTVTTFWFALEDATLDNGCLWVQPGGHRGSGALPGDGPGDGPGDTPGILRERYVCEQGRLRMDRLPAPPWPSLDQAVPLPVAAGTLVVFHGLLPHRSAANRSAASRLAYTLHVTDGRAAYAASNWLQRGASFPVRGLAGDAPGSAPVSW